MLTERQRRVLVIIQRRLSEPRAAQGLRAAVGYAALGIKVTVALCKSPDADSEIGSNANSINAGVQRHLKTLRVLGHTVQTVDAEELSALCDDAPDVTIVW